MKILSLITPNFNRVMDAVKFANRQAPICLVYSYVLGLCCIYVLVMVHTPMVVLPEFGHDDGLFITLGRSLAEGKWLGRFSQFTLMKGPGYPAFLALNNWLGIPVSLGHALFHCFAITFFVAVCHRFIKSYLISAVFLGLMLWHPISFTGEIRRVFREEIYYGQTLLVLGLMLWVLFCPARNERRRLYAVIAGAALGWFWLTREEGLWIVPALALMALVAAFQTFHSRWDLLRYPRASFNDQRLRGIAVALSITTGVFAAIQIGFNSVNWFVYGQFVGIDFKEANFQRALRAINSVRSGNTKPFVSITRTAMKRVEKVSPTFASLSPYFDGPGKAWGAWGCEMHRSNTCGEFDSAFVWALRDAASWNGHYSSPSAASAFFGRLADEILAACHSRKLECRPQLIAEMPPIRWTDVIRRMLPRYVDAFALVILRNPPLQFDSFQYERGTSEDSEYQVAAALRFLNYPLSIQPGSELLYTLTGWYYKFENEWITAEVRTPTGDVVSSRFARRDSLDVAQYFKDPNASNQRFSLFARCSDACVLILRASEGVKVKKTFAELRNAPVGFELGKGHVYIERLDPDPQYTLSRFDRLCSQIRRAVAMFYSLIFLPILAFGLIAFLVSALVFWKRAIWNVCFVVAFISWGLAFERVTLLVLIDSTSFPALFLPYLAPTYFVLVSGAVLSIAALSQVSGPGNQALSEG